jgi:hypothetical protein
MKKKKARMVDQSFISNQNPDVPELLVSLFLLKYWYG